MIKIKAKYDNIEEKEMLLSILNKGFKVLRTSKEYDEGKLKRCHIDICKTL